MNPVVVTGRSIGGLTCARLLARRGRAVHLAGAEAGSPPWLVLNEVTVQLLLDVWGEDAGLLDDGWPLARRHVRWGHTGAAEVVDQPSVAVDGRRLVRRLTGLLTDRSCGLVLSTDEDPESPAPGCGRWTVASRPPPGGHRVEVGRRCVLAAGARLRPGEDASTCWFETTREAWVYLAPVGRERALIQAMLPGPVHNPDHMLSDLLDRTGLCARLAGGVGAADVVSAAPSLLSPPCGADWLAVGTAAARFDPLSGSGTAHAMRTAILAAAVIDAVARGISRPAVLTHYATRIRTSFIDHLGRCLRFYREAFASDMRADVWRDEIEATALALRGAHGEPRARERFKLVDWRLEPSA